MDPTQKYIDEAELSTTCMTLTEFKAQWMIVLQRGKVESQIIENVYKSARTKRKNDDRSDVGNNKDFNGRNLLFPTKGGRLDIQRLRKRRRFGRQNIPSGSSANNDSEHAIPTKQQTDIYDCYHQVTIPSSHDAIDMVVEDVIQQWRALDERKISAGVVDLPQSQQRAQPQPHSNRTANNNNNNNNKNSHNTNIKPLPKWYEKHIRLPDGFDYASVRTEPPPVQDNDDRVVNFMDPSRPLSYHTELWKLFHSIPTRQQIEESLCRPHQLPNMNRWFHETTDDDNNDGVGGGAILQGSKVCSTTDWDFYGLSRFRLNDRHDLPPVVVATESVVDTGNRNIGSNTQYCGLLRLECLRKQLRRTSTPDPNRMVLEFLESHTLYDVHCAIVELTDDELWYDYANTVPISSISIQNDDDEDEEVELEEGGRDDGNNNRSQDSTTGNSDEVNTARKVTSPSPTTTSSDRASVVNDRASSGYFLIENTFYTTGPVDYTTPILQWLQTGTVREQKRRLEYLGIGPIVPNVQSMSEMPLSNLPTRLGVRYVHAHHGDVECAIFVTDRRLMLQEEVQQIHQFPIIHDVWSSSYSIPDCEICQSRVAVIATSTECHVTNGHVALCEACCRQLRLPHTSRNHIERYTIWRGQSDLSAGASKEVTW